MPDLTGKVAIVTGGSRGIGEAATSALVQKGCEGKLDSFVIIAANGRAVHIISATEAHANTAIDNISEHTANAKSLVHTHQVDLGSLKDVISLGQSLASSLPRIDMLYLIAGIGVAPFGLTKDGLGNHFAVNHLAHMVLVDQLLGKMKETSGKKSGGDVVEKYSTRIVAESSELHRTAPGDVKCENEEEMSHEKDPNRLYARSKLFKLAFLSSTCPGTECIQHLLYPPAREIPPSPTRLAQSNHGTLSSPRSGCHRTAKGSG